MKTARAEPEVIVIIFEDQPYTFAKLADAAEWVARKLGEGHDIGEFTAYVDDQEVPIRWKSTITVQIGDATSEVTAE